MRRTLALLLLGYALFGSAQPAPRAGADAQSGARKQATTFTSRSELVLIPVVVNGPAGPLTGLTKEQFELRDNGKPRVISSFEEVKGSAAPLAVAPLQKQHFSNHPEGPESAHRVTVILLDFLNTEAPDQLRARRAVIEYLGNSLQANEPTALLVLNTQGLHQIHSFTTSTATLIAAIRQAQAGRIEAGAVASAAPVNQLATSDAADLVRVVDETLGVKNLVYAPEVAATTDMQANSLKEFGFQLDTLRAMEMISQAYAGIPGRKSLVWVTAGFWLRYPVTNDIARRNMERNAHDGLLPGQRPPDVQSHPGALNDAQLRQQTSTIWKMLSGSNIAVYPVDVVGLKGYESIAGPVPGERSPKEKEGAQKYHEFDQLASDAQDAEVKDSYRLYADATGGRPCVNDNDIRECLGRAARDAAHFYMLGFYLSPQQRDRGWHTVTLKLNAKYNDLRYRKGYMVEEEAVGPAAIVADMQSMDAAFASPLDYTGVPLDVTVTRIAPSGDRRSLSLDAVGDKRKLSFNISFPPNAFLIDREDDNHVELDLVARAYDPKTGKFAGFIRRGIEAHLKPESVTLLGSEGLIHRDSMIVTPGKYEFKVVVRDRLTGKMGSVTAAIEAL